MNAAPPRRKRVLLPPKDKFARYRQKQLKMGNCPHCGKTCAPYAECPERRTYKAISMALSTLVRVGKIQKIKRGLYQKLPPIVTTAKP